jgi:hypothetical protein
MLPDLEHETLTKISNLHEELERLIKKFEDKKWNWKFHPNIDDHSHGNVDYHV